ncbi:phage capsid protein [Clostridium botulinum]|uniref:phage scaffolding protein n=1 Tax=Clostridium TaxID=1485 RepID=UPI00035BA7E0|nr:MULTISPECIES: phage scaffolding protein [Clostridium]AJD27845.1 phage minor structural GP20 family protein [Clostridium botulinum CDC_297]EPS50150.1 phage scaffold protein [Clostridium botulinum A1 str. CFSAN002368]MBY6878395.1 phage scaffolding protein [Clostridium botulinum]MBY6892035.1 phage scaffolding protein [Clostridium botulinum]MBY6894469.1 phage scaffolding protein [Clostridium botulinum]
MAHIKDIIGEEAFNALSEDKRKELDKKDFEDVSSGSFILKTRFDQVNEQAKEYKKQVGERDKQINNLKEEYKDVDGLKEKVEQLELDNKTQKETYEKQLSDIAFNNALEKGLGAFSIKDKKLIMALIDKDKLKVDGDNVIGLKEQIEPLKTSHEYLFDKEIKGTGSFVTGGNNDTQPNKTNFASELGKQRAENMKAKSLTDFAK